MCIRDRSEISVISENVMVELQEVNKHIPSLPVAGVTVVGVTGVRSKRVTKQVQLNIYISETEFENTFLVVKGLNLDVILGNDFLERNGAVIDFNKRMVEFKRWGEPVRVSFERVLDKVRAVSYTHLDVYKRQAPS